MFLSLSVSCFGTLIGIRIIEGKAFEDLLLSTWKTKIVTAHIVCSGIIGLLFLSNALANWLLQGSLLVCLVGARELLKRYRLQSFNDQFLQYMDVVVLQMHAGRSFRDSLRSSLHAQDPFFVLRMTEILQIVVFSQQNQGVSHHFAKELVDEFQMIDQTPHAALNRVQNFRKKLLMIDSFRRKSGQVLLQARIQCLVMSAMYLALLLYMGLTSGFSQHKQLLALSMLLFACGLTWALKIGRRLKWKL